MVYEEKTTSDATGYGPATDVRQNSQWFRMVLLILVALSSYLSVPLVSGGRLLVPSVATVALMPLLFLTVRKSISTTDVVFILKVGFLLLVSIVLSPGHKFMTEKLLSLVQCCLAIAVLVMTVRLMQEIRRQSLERALIVLWLLIVVGSILEVTGVIRDVSDSFRTWAYQGVFSIYEGDERDVNLVGWLRPKLFSTEPSHVSKLFIVAINSWLLVSVTRTKVVISVVATVLMFLIMGSPMFLVSTAITFAILLWNRRASLQSKVSIVAVSLVIGAIFVAYFGQSAVTTLESRVERIGDTTSGEQLEKQSENLRVVFPYVTLLDTWSRWPLFGVGFGGDNVVMEHSVFHGVNPKFAIGTNAAGELGTFLGLIGGTWFVWLFMRQIKQTGAQRLGLMLAILAMFSQLMGGIAGFRYWGFVALFWGALAVADAEVDSVGRS